MPRSLRYGLLVWYNLAYRACVLVVQFAFTLLAVRSISLGAWPQTAGYVVAWNVLNTLLHYGFDVIFFRRFRVGK